jgi:hypothetical protein
MRIHHRSRSARSGFTLVDVCIAVAILAIALGVLLGTVFWAMRLDEVNEETAAASQGVRSLLESLNGMPLDEVYAAYNEDPRDDPSGRDYREYLAVHDPLLRVGKNTAPLVRVSFPEGAEIELAERRLPVTLRLEWEGSSGPREVQMTTLLRGR